MSQSSDSSATRSLPPAVSAPANQTVLNILLALSTAHMLNDTFQAMLPAIYPLLKEKFSLTFTQVGLITLTFQGIASLLQPFVGGFEFERKLFDDEAARFLVLLRSQTVVFQLP